MMDNVNGIDNFYSNQSNINTIVIHDEDKINSNIYNRLDRNTINYIFTTISYVDLLKNKTIYQFYDYIEEYDYLGRGKPISDSKIENYIINCINLKNFNKRTQSDYNKYIMPNEILKYMHRSKKVVIPFIYYTKEEIDKWVSFMRSIDGVIIDNNLRLTYTRLSDIKTTTTSHPRYNDIVINKELRIVNTIASNIILQQQFPITGFNKTKWPTYQDEDITKKYDYWYMDTNRGIPIHYHIYYKDSNRSNLLLDNILLLESKHDEDLIKNMFVEYDDINMVVQKYTLIPSIMHPRIFKVIPRDLDLDWLTYKQMPYRCKYLDSDKEAYSYLKSIQNLKNNTENKNTIRECRCCGAKFRIYPYNVDQQYCSKSCNILKSGLDLIKYHNNIVYSYNKFPENSLNFEDSVYCGLDYFGVRTYKEKYVETDYIPYLNSINDVETRRILIDLFIYNDINMQKLVKQLNTTLYSLLPKFMYFGIPYKLEFGPNINSVKNLYKNSNVAMTIDNLARAYNVNKNVIRKWLDREGCKISKKGKLVKNSINI